MHAADPRFRNLPAALTCANRVTALRTRLPAGPATWKRRLSAGARPGALREARGIEPPTRSPVLQRRLAARIAASKTKASAVRKAVVKSVQAFSGI